MMPLLTLTIFLEIGTVIVMPSRLSRPVTVSPTSMLNVLSVMVTSTPPCDCSSMSFFLVSVFSSSGLALE